MDSIGETLVTHMEKQYPFKMIEKGTHLTEWVHIHIHTHFYLRAFGLTLMNAHS